MVMVLSMLVCTSLLMSLCICIVSNALIMSSATMSVRADDCFWLKPVAIMLKSNAECFSVLGFFLIFFIGIY